MRIFRAKPLNWHHISDMQIGLVDGIFCKHLRQELGFHRQMFDEDFARLFRSKNRQSGKLFTIESNDDTVVQKLLGGVEAYLKDEKVQKLVEEIAQFLIRFGRAYYFLYENIEQDEVNLASISSDGVARLFGKHIQWVPKRTERHWDRDDEKFSREIRILDGAKVMRFDMPASIKRMLSAQNKTLAVIDKYHFKTADFHPQATHENPNPKNPFDFRVWNDTQERAFYRATVSTGWNGRKYDSLKRSDFFDCHRLIRFRRNQLLLRDAILNQLSVELSRIGKGYTAGFSVEISGTEELPCVAHLNELAVRLDGEKVGFNEIIDYVYKR
ncbi:hypothetical protein [Pseudomonas chlororaphis]|uniref:hypothetical protein n=1 Tax=Pseudomonas chlororaphis TaxID=587753 RepID=UPI0005F954AD|nr:hypothetical protein [Pseudomonas chlororaphis]